MSHPKLLWHSNAPWTSTGYGQQVATFAPRLAQHYPLTLSAFHGLEGAPLSWNGIRVLPGEGKSFGSDAMAGHVHAEFGGPRDGIVLTLMDVWVLKTGILRGMNVASWVPVDHEPVTPGVHNYFAATGAVPLAMSKFGAEQLAGFDPLYVPHGIDTEVYSPVAEARETIGFPEGFIIGIVGANQGIPSRKCFPEMLQAFALFHKQRPDAKLYLHTETSGGPGNGFDLAPLIDSLGIPKGAIMYGDQYRYRFDPLAPQQMAALYSSFDVLLSTSKGEGFGLPVLEAQACGTPVIVSDFSAQRELCGSGWRVEGRREWTPHQSWQFLPDIDDILAALESAYDTPPELRERMSEQAREHSLQYDADHVVSEHFLPALKEVERRFKDREPMAVAA